MLVSRASALADHSTHSQAVFIFKGDAQRPLFPMSASSRGRCRGLLFRGLEDKHEGLILFILVVVVEIPKLFLCLPPLDDPTEASDGEQDLDVPVPAVPIWMLVPRFSDVLNTLNKRLADLWLGCQLCGGHFCDIGSNANEVVQGGHDRINRVINEYA